MLTLNLCCQQGSQEGPLAAAWPPPWYHFWRFGRCDGDRARVKFSCAGVMFSWSLLVFSSASISMGCLMSYSLRNGIQVGNRTHLIIHDT